MQQLETFSKAAAHIGGDIIQEFKTGISLWRAKSRLIAQVSGELDALHSVFAKENPYNNKSFAIEHYYDENVTFPGTDIFHLSIQITDTASIREHLFLLPGKYAQFNITFKDQDQKSVRHILLYRPYEEMLPDESGLLTNAWEIQHISREVADGKGRVSFPNLDSHTALATITQARAVLDKVL